MLFRCAGLKLSSKKCNLFRREVTYFGYVISADGVVTDPSKTPAIDEWPVPKPVKDVRRFVGLCTYCWRFILEFAEMIRPLHRLTEKGKTFDWTDDRATAFQHMKLTLTTAPVSPFPESYGAFTVDTDASGVGIGCILSQVQEGKERVIAYYSRTQRKTDRNYRACKWVTIHGVTPRDWSLLGTKRD